MTTADVLARQLDDTRDWTLKLIADFAGDDWRFQPKPGMGHALWLCGHAATAEHQLINVRCLGAPGLPDEFTRHFPIGGQVISADEHDYPPPDEIKRVMAEVHARTLEAVRGMSDDILAEPAFGKDGAVHPHYTDKLGAVSHCARHEAFHAGQLATLRRLLGKPFLR